MDAKIQNIFDMQQESWINLRFRVKICMKGNWEAGIVA
jgi:plasmid maintenance system antidote protein VapI